MSLSLSQLMGGISHVESGGNYNAISAAGALGKYQIMPANLPSWGAAAGYPGITSSQFLANPTAQDAIAGNQLSIYQAKYGDYGAAQAWLGGPGSVGKNVTDTYTGLGSNQYANNALSYGAGLPASDTSGQSLNLPNSTSFSGAQPGLAPGDTGMPSTAGSGIGADQGSSYASINPSAQTSNPALASSTASPGSIISGLWEYTGSTATTTGDQTIAAASTAAAKTTAQQSASDTKSLNQTAQQNTKALNTTSTANTQNLTSTLSNIASAGISDVFNLFSRSFVIIIGLVFLAGAVFMASRQQGGVKAALAG